MTPIVPRVAIFSHSHPTSLNLKTTDGFDWFATDFETHLFYNDVSANILVNNRFNLQVYIGNTCRWLQSQNNKIPKIYIENESQLTGDLLYKHYTDISFTDVNPQISMFTPTYKTFEKFNRLYNSLLNQSFTNWELIILDDSPTDENLKYMSELVGQDHRVKIYKPNRTDGLIGSTKRQAASLCNGDYIMEVDHDDELHHMALESCINAFKKYPDAGFCYSNCAEILETGGVVNYGDDFGLGEGIHIPTHYQGRYLLGTDTPINASTMRHIVGAPNHFRCWRKDVYNAVGKHNNKLAIVDDYELIVRTFLYTRIIHIPETLYIQYMNANGNNTQEPRRKEIQRLVDRVQKHYDKQIHDRIIELGGVDWMWNDDTQSSDMWRRSPSFLKRSTLAYVYKL